MDMTRIVFEALWDDVRQVGPFLLVTVSLAAAMCAIAAVRNEPTIWRDVPGGMFWGWIAAMAAAICFTIASAFIEEFIRKTYGYNNWRVLQIFALCIFGPICLFACYWIAGAWLRYKIKLQRIRQELGLPVLPHRWYAISMRTLLLIQLVVFLTIGGWYSAHRGEIKSRYRWEQKLAWQETVHSRFGRYGWRLIADQWLPLMLMGDQPLVGFDDQVLEKLDPADELKMLQINSDQLTDVGMRFIGEQTSLEFLTIKTENVTDAGLAELAKLPKLNYLSLNCPNLTDAALAELQKCSALKNIIILSPEISREALAAYQAAKPEVHIHVNHPWLPTKKALPQVEAEKE